ncbi:DAR GTPase 3, chloroplastic [Galdieria sulphuraria]|nr:DAR GTPase 3, chloroplastic [Galdieria sulphuraria]
MSGFLSCSIVILPRNSSFCGLKKLKLWRTCQYKTVVASVNEGSKDDIRRPKVQWYPGHIAKAERVLKDKLRLVDVVLEVRDARIPKSTEHPELQSWLGEKKRLVVLNRRDMVPQEALSVWIKTIKQQGFEVFDTNAKLGNGIQRLRKALIFCGKAINEKRRVKGLLPRSVHCMIVGYPNVGKSALINRLVNRAIAKSQNRPGVTRTFQWIQVSDQIQLLDSPGIIPPKLVSQSSAEKLAFCNDIGSGSYDNQVVASALLECIRNVGTVWSQDHCFVRFNERFGIDMLKHSGEMLLEIISRKQFSNDKEKTAQKILAEFRQGLWGPLCLEWPCLKKHRLLFF